jgi:hypothetical protein
MKPEQIAQAVAMNRVMRSLWSRTRTLADKAADGAPAAEVRADGDKLRRQLAAIKRDAFNIVALWKSKLQYVQSWGLDPAAAPAWAYVSALSPAALRDAVPHIIERLNGGDATARPFAAAIIVALDRMEKNLRPMTPDHFANLLKLDDFDVLSRNAKEAAKLANAVELATTALATAGALPAATKLQVGGELKGLRSADQLTEEDAAVLTIEEEPNDATVDPSEPDGADDDNGSDRGGEAGAADENGDPAETADADAENLGGTEGSGEAQGVGDLV